MKQKINVLLTIFFIIVICANHSLAGYSASITVTVAIVTGVIDPAMSAIEVNPFYIPIQEGLSTITVIPKDKTGTPVGAGQTVQIFASAGTLINDVIDHGDGSYTQILEASNKVEAAIISAIVNDIPIYQQPTIYFTKSEPAKILMISGNDQTGVIGNPLVEPLVIEIIDAKEKPVEGVPVTFSVEEGGGNIFEEQPVTTDKKGLASVMLTLGDEPGQNTVTASLEGVDGSPVTFTATAILPLIKAVWIYSLEKIKPEEQKKILSLLKDFGINRIYLDLEKNDSLLLDTTEGYDMVAKFVEMAATSGMDVEAMILQDSEWIDLDEQWDKDTLRKDEIVRRVNTIIYSDVPFIGIHIDVQPHKHHEWSFNKWKINNELMIGFKDLLWTIRASIAASRASSTIHFSATVAWWYNNAALDDLLPEGDALRLSSSIDYMVPLVYENYKKPDHNCPQEAGDMDNIMRVYNIEFQNLLEDIHPEVNDFAESPPQCVSFWKSLFKDSYNPVNYWVYYCVFDEIEKLRNTGKGVVIGFNTQKLGIHEEIRPFIEWQNNSLSSFDSYFGTSIYKTSYLTPKEMKRISIKSTGRVNLSVITPQGREIDRENMEQAHDILYVESDPIQDTIMYDEIVISNPNKGEYQVKIIPESDSKDTDRFTLTVTIDGEATVITEDIQIKDIPETPYVISFPI
ncbi:MAG: invasin domain 3-containing protein [bacterium]